MLIYEPESTPFDLRFRLFGTSVRVHPMFWLVTILLGWNVTNDPILSDNGFVDLAVWIFCVFFSILLHELGHVWMGRLFGSEGYIVLQGLFGLAIGSNNVSSWWKRVLVSFAGPGIQLLLWSIIVGCLWVARLQNANILSIIRFFCLAPERVMLILYPDQKPIALLIGMLLQINFWWPVINLLPVWHLDGGMISRELCIKASPSRGLLVSLWFSLIVAVVIAANGAIAEKNGGKGFIPYVGGNMFMAIFFAMFAAGNFQEIQQETGRRRSFDDRLPWER